MKLASDNVAIAVEERALKDAARAANAAGGSGARVELRHDLTLDKDHDDAAARTRRAIQRTVSASHIHDENAGGLSIGSALLFGVHAA